MAILAAAFILTGCGSELMSEYIDPSAELTRDDFKQGLAAQEPVASPPPPPIPDLQPVITTPSLGSVIRSQRVTVSVTETTPLKDVLIELAREARIDLELDPRIEGGVIFSAYDRPFDEVLRRLSDLAGLRYKFKDGVMRIELDDPYHTTYKLGYLSLVRTASSNVGTSAAVTGSGSEASVSRGAGNNSSSSRVQSTSVMNFWEELISNVTQILTNTATRTGLVAIQAPEPVIRAAGDTRVDTVFYDGPVGEAYSAGGGVALRSDTGQIDENFLAAVVDRVRADTATQERLSGVIATDKSETSRTDLAQQVAASETGAVIPSLTPAFASASSLFTVNRQAGIVSVFGTERQHRQIESYLRALRKSVSAQVLIEAKILEVTLDDEFRFGVNWAMLGGGRFNAAAPFNTATTPLVQAPPFDQLINAPANAITATANVLTVGIDFEDLNAVANAVEQFGTVRALSSPRITVMQNQTAVLKVAENDVYFTVEFDSKTTTGDNPTIVNTVSATANTVTVGLVMTVQPSINLDTDEITLSLRPTVTRIIRQENDPAVDLQGIAGVVSQIPVIGVQEMDSVVTMASGSVMIMGGLMQDRTAVTEFGVPFLSDIPWLGRVFRSTDRVTTKTELVIFLRATIVRNDTVDAYDIKLYDQFGEDRRPLVFQN